MSTDEEHGHDLYIRGVAAARAHDNEEARFYLEWALQEWEAYGEYDEEKLADANLWLSRVSDDPKKKRDYLETVLAMDPTHAEARRDLAILDGRLKPEDIADLNQPLPPLSPAAAPPADEVRRITCPQCGGRLSYDVNTRALRCQFCGYTPSPAPEARPADNQAQPGTGAPAAAPPPASQDFLAAVYTARGHRWELPTARTLTCQGCGAHFTLAPSQVAGACPFCGSAYIVETKDLRELIEPTGVIPFQFDAPAATRHLQQFLREQKAEGNRQLTFSPPRAVYLPFWSFAVGGEVRWRGLLRERRDADGQMAWVERSGSELAMNDEVLVCGTRSLDAQLAAALAAEGFDQRALAPYAEKFLVDWPAELYQIALADASLLAHQRAFEDARARLQQGSASGARDLTLDPTAIVIDTYKLLLAPVWLGELQPGAGQVPFAINGQSGKVHAHLPPTGLGRFLDWLGA